MKRSKQLVKGHVVEMLGLVGMSVVLGFVSIIPIIGTIINAALSFILTPSAAIRYLQLKALEQSKQPTKTHWVNYLLVLAPGILAVAMLALAATSGVQIQERAREVEQLQQKLEQQQQNLDQSN